jgi:hypothetical protein
VRFARSTLERGSDRFWIAWAQVEGRLLAMLEGVAQELRLDLLNETTQAWVELEYQRTPHREIGETSPARFLAGPDVLRPSPRPRRSAPTFTTEQTRAQRRSDGTISVAGVRFEVPARFAHLTRLTIRYARLTKKLQQLYGLKWNPFTPDVPTEALYVTARVESFGWRVEQLVREGGFRGDPRRPGHRQVGRAPPAGRRGSPPCATSSSASSRARTPASPMATGSSAICLASASALIIAGPARKPYGTPGAHTSRRRAFGPSCSSTKRRTCASLE